MDLNPRFRFETFVVGPSNRLAFTAAQAVAEQPGVAYNPLFLYGRSGLGKTHLLHAAGAGAREHQSTLGVRYLTLEEFVEQFHAAVAATQVEAFRRSAEETDVLLIDDVQFLAKHREMQAELLRLSERMQAAGKQLILASDRPPAEIEEIDERLISRLSGGLLVDLASPDFETRLAILRRKAEERGMNFQPGVLETVAEIGASNVRELVGLVNRLIAFQAVAEAPLSPAGARALLTGEEVGSQADGGQAASGQVERGQGVGAGAQADRGQAPAAGGPPADEFSGFLSAITRSVAQSIDAWKGRIGEAVVRWQGEGYRTSRLETLLQGTEIPNVQAELDRYAQDVAALQALAQEAAALDPAAAGQPRFRDPDAIDAARDYLRELSEGIAPPPGPASALTFEDYIVGSANEAVVRAARTIAEQPGTRFNPLFIAGASGVGKTHLLHAIGNALAATGRRVVAALPAQAFVEELLAAITDGRIEWWRRRYRRADAFLLDDVQLIGGKEQTQDELFNLFNVFADGDRQLVFAADRAPHALLNVAPRLVTRFEGGLVVELAAPDRAMREVMVRRLLEAHKVVADAEVAQYLAARPADSARALQGIVNRALSAMDGGEDTLTLAAARRAIEGRASRPSQAHAISALIPAGLDPALQGREKILWEWPEIGDRVMEEPK